MRSVTGARGLSEDDVRRKRRLNRRLNLPGGWLVSGVFVAAIVYMLGSTPE